MEPDGAQTHIVYRLGGRCEIDLDVSRLKINQDCSLRQPAAEFHCLFFSGYPKSANTILYDAWLHIHFQQKSFETRLLQDEIVPY